MRIELATTASVLLALAGSSQSLAAVTFGDNLAEDPDTPLNCGSLCTASTGGSAPEAQAAGGRLAPSDGVVVRWRIEVGATTTPVALRITRPGSADAVQRTGGGTGPTVTPPINQTSTFDVRLPVQSGDALGIDCCANQPLQAFALNPNADNLLWTPPLVDGGPLTMFTAATLGLELLVNADMEPDADRDGFGDETQDQCPGDALKHLECDPPETEITKNPPDKNKKAKAKYRFTSDEPGSSFECSLRGKGLDQLIKRFGDCASPRRYKRLDPGKFRFKVRAVDIAGNVDPSPAKDRFKVVN